MIKRLTLIVVGIILTISLMAQHQGRSCGSFEYNQYLEQKFPEVKQNRMQIEEFTAEFIKDFRENRQSARLSVVTIPVVVHVIYHPSYPAQQISYSRVVEQINILNQDFRAMNSDTSIVPSMFKGDITDPEIQFCLASRDPNGNWTDGVIFVPTTKTGFSMGEDASIKSTALGGHDPWDRNKYMNIWVCNLTGNVLGFTTLPGGPAYLDGLVIGFRYFGKTGAQYPYDLGRTTTHEVGHWLSLFHIWGDDNGACWGTDYCNDTPNQASDNYGCPSFPHSSCSNTSDMYMNYMDYVDDRCMVMFTFDQKARMWAALNGPRSSILTSDGCMPHVGLSEPSLFEEISIFPIPASDVINVRVNLTASHPLTIKLIDQVGRCISFNNLEASNRFLQQIPMEGLSRGIYYLKVEAAGIVEIRKVPVL